MFSPLGYHGVQVLEHKQRPSDLLNMEHWGIREHVCCGTVCSDGTHDGDTGRISP